MKKLKVTDKALEIKATFDDVSKDYKIIEERYMNQLEQLRKQFWKQPKEDYPEMTDGSWTLTDDYKYVYEKMNVVQLDCE